MGVLNLGPALYGGARALQDIQQQDKSDKSFELDQQAREENLQAIREARPLRKRVLEGEAQRLDTQNELDKLNIDESKLKKEDLDDARKRAKDAVRIHDALVGGMRQFRLSTDPQHLADALKTIDPEKGANVKATRNADNSITIDGGQGHPITFRGKTKKPDGSAMTPDEELEQFTAHYVDPVKGFMDDYGYAQKKGLEKTKEDAATERARIAAGSRERVAGTRAGQSEVRFQLGKLKGSMDSALKTTGVSGSFISGYAHTDDAELRAVMDADAEALIKDGKPANEAVKQVIDDVRTTGDAAKKEVTKRAAEVRKSKVDPKDLDAVRKAAKAGNKAAADYLIAVEGTEKALGKGFSKYLVENLSAK